MTLQQKEKGIFLDDSIIKQIRAADGIIFDCDGVLVDVRKSYDLTIVKTTQYVLENFFGISNTDMIDSEIIDGFKARGGFNDEVDVTYAAILSLVAAKKLNENPREFLFKTISHADQSGIFSVEKFLETLVDIYDVKNKLDYPGPHHKNPLYKIFDQLFYGPILYFKLFRQQSAFSDKGFIENDKVLFSKPLSDKLKKKFHKKMGIVTGRGIESIRYSMKKLLDEFDLKNSAFLEDEPRKLAKPNPEPLLRAIEGMGVKTCIYVGDSMEDLIMAKAATEMGHDTIFCGIIGTSNDPEKKLELLEGNGAKIVLESINLLPKVLNLE